MSGQRSNVVVGMREAVDWVEDEEDVELVEDTDSARGRADRSRPMSRLGSGLWRWIRASGGGESVKWVSEGKADVLERPALVTRLENAGGTKEEIGV